MEKNQETQSEKPTPIRSRPRGKSIKKSQDSTHHAFLAEEETRKLEMEAATASFRYEDPRATKEDMERRQLVLDVAMKKNLERVEKMLSEFGRAEDGGEMMGRRGESGKMAGGPAVRREPDDVEIE